MARLLGTFEHSLDAKGRYTVPAKLRTALGEEFIAVAGAHPCVLLYPLSRWDALEKRIEALPEFDELAEELRRLFGSDAAELRVDAQWRVVIPAHLKNWARLEREVVTVGAFTRCEVWDRETFLEHKQKLRSSPRLGEARKKFPL